MQAPRAAADRIASQSEQEVVRDLAEQRMRGLFESDGRYAAGLGRIEYLSLDGPEDEIIRGDERVSWYTARIIARGRAGQRSSAAFPTMVIWRHSAATPEIVDVRPEVRGYGVTI